MRGKEQEKKKRRNQKFFSGGEIDHNLNDAKNKGATRMKPQIKKHACSRSVPDYFRPHALY